MTVKELIKELEKYPQDTKVMYVGAYTEGEVNLPLTYSSEDKTVEIEIFE